MKNTINLGVLLICLTTALSCTRSPIQVFVSNNGNDQNEGTEEMPLATINAALAKIKTLKTDPQSSTEVRILAGSYHLESSLKLTPDLSNTSIIGEGKVSIKGSRTLLSKWQAVDKNIWVTDVPSDINFNQLFINGKMQHLARYPNYSEDGGYWNGSAKDAISEERVLTWKSPEGGYVHAMHRGKWGGFHYEITGKSEDGTLDLIGGHQNNRPSIMHPELRMVENIFEELDIEKEWYHDKKSGKLYLWKEDKVDLDNAVIEISVLDHLVEVIGSESVPVTNIEISGIHFLHTKRTFMKEYHRLLRSDWTIYRGGAILLDGTVGCIIKDCELSDLGGNVIFATGYNRNLEVSGNHIYNCGATAISFVGDSTAVRSPSFQYSDFVPFSKIDLEPGPANNLYSSECIVVDNLIHDIGKVEKQVAGVQISMSMKIHVRNNSIYNVPRAGINVSEGTWGGHLIEYNDVFNTVLETGDHGSFNSWGRDRFWHPKWNKIDSNVRANPHMPNLDAIHTTVIRNNRFRCDHGWDIDLDDGSSNYQIYNNLCLNGGIKLREGFNRVVENNIMVNNGFHPHVWFENSGDIFRKNVMMTKHFPIRLAGWGQEVDYNLFPDSAAMVLAQENATDINSTFGNPSFRNPEKGDYWLEEESPAFALGFENFAMDSFGVQKSSLKAMAQQPAIPELNINAFNKVPKKTRKWLGGKLKEVDSAQEQSAYGLPDMNGIIVLELEGDSKLSDSGIAKGDVIVAIIGKRIKGISDFLNKYQENQWKGSVEVIVMRNQTEKLLKINSQ